MTPALFHTNKFAALLRRIQKFDANELRPVSRKAGSNDCDTWILAHRPAPAKPRCGGTDRKKAGAQWAGFPGVCWSVVVNSALGRFLIQFRSPDGAAKLVNLGRESGSIATFVDHLLGGNHAS